MLDPHGSEPTLLNFKKFWPNGYKGEEKDKEIATQALSDIPPADTNENIMSNTQKKRIFLLW